MQLIAKADLQYTYSWTVISPDNPKVTGVPDSTLLNRHEGYEVLAFINRIATASKWMEKAPCLKAERMIKNYLPSDLRSHAHVWQWLCDNWTKYQ